MTLLLFHWPTIRRANRLVDQAADAINADAYRDAVNHLTEAHHLYIQAHLTEQAEHVNRIITEVKHLARE